MRDAGTIGLGAGVALGLLIAPAPAAVCIPGFAAKAVFDVGRNAGVSALADLDADGRIDLLAGDLIFLGDGCGGFSRTSIRLSPADYTVFDAAFADFDLDGRLDVALCRWGDDSVLFLFGQPSMGPGRPAFGDPVSVSTLQGIWHLAIVDLTQDGLPDLTAIGLSSGGFSVLTNLGGRRFRSEPHEIPSDGGYHTATGDFDGDGHADVANAFSLSLLLSFGNGDGQFRKTTRSVFWLSASPFAPHRVDAADFDGDGKSDLVAIGQTLSGPSGIGEGLILSYSGNEIAANDGLPDQPSCILPIEGTGRFLGIEDVNADGLLDIVAQSAGSDGVAVLQCFFGQRRPETGEWMFAAGPPIRTSLSGIGSVLAIGDLDGASGPDFVLTTEDTGEGQVFLNDGACPPRADRGDANADNTLDLGDAIAALGYIVSGSPLPCPEAAEVNGDGRLDIADAVYLLLYIFASGPALQGPTPVSCHPAGG
ncbi:MAG: VCBS repeat-containing protein [Planctomycetes bacterium]|nr:VCBS repeat-containing protein [Planctomycetota bacterium]